METIYRMHKSSHQSSHRGERRHAHNAFWHEGFWADGRRGRHHRGDHPHQRGRRGRFLDQGDLRLIILSLIAEAPRHGYEIIKLVEDRTGGAYSPSPGVVYPTLTLLEDTGLAAVRATEGARKLYTITPDGQAQLDANRAALDALAARIARIGERRAAPPPQIERAVENLRTALRLRLEQGLEPGDSQKIADALDAAAKTIERVIEQSQPQR
jgi:DNA-binding PadR family transcriptional regulator